VYASAQTLLTAAGIVLSYRHQEMRIPAVTDQTNSDRAAVAVVDARTLGLSGPWTARGLGALGAQFDAAPGNQQRSADATRVSALDTAGARVLLGLLQGLKPAGEAMALHGLRPDLARRLESVAAQMQEQAAAGAVAQPIPPSILEQLGRGALARANDVIALLSFVGKSAAALAGWVRHPARIRWRPVLFNLRSAGVDALPIVGLLAFMLGVVVAYQSADQLRQYGANLFIADIVGISMLREFAPLITAIIIAGRSGSAYAAQIGTMAVTEEIDALSTLGIRPLDMLVLPKVIALAVALPLLTVFADVLGIVGGMVMAQLQLQVDYNSFLDRLVKAVGVGTFLVGVGKAVVFAVIIAVVGCFQGFLTRGGADSVGRQTTRSVVQAIVGVVAADGLFSVIFSALDL
jgi:phospholipid/cholesterol/gamma-HCH transport system permease protein